MDAPLASFRIDSLMRRHFIVVGPEDTVEDVLRLMALARVRILPVVRHGVLVGIVGYRTLALSLLQTEPGDAVADRDGHRIAELMEQPGETVPAQAPSETVARRLCESGHGCIPVVEGGETGLRIVGLVTESDLLEAAYRTGRRPTPAPLSRPS
jgi:CBS domain-containing protein